MHRIDLIFYTVLILHKQTSYVYTSLTFHLDDGVVMNKSQALLSIYRYSPV